MGIGTHAVASASAAFGKGITANVTESLALSGTAYASNFLLHDCDARLVKNVQDTDPVTMLHATEKLRVVTHEPSDNACRHRGRAAADCARDRSTGLLAQQVGEVLPGAVRSGTSLKLVDGGGRVLEHVPDVASLDVRALLAQLVGSVQALSAENKALGAENKALAEQARVHAAELRAVRAELRRL